MSLPLYEDTSRYDSRLKAIIGSMPAMTFLPGLFLMFDDKSSALIMFATTLFATLLFKAALPRRCRIFQGPN